VDAERRVERTYLPELYRVRAVARNKLGDHENAVQDARTAVAIAVAQRATPLIRSAEATLRELLEGPQVDVVERVGGAILAGGAEHEGV
jgi:hypothetical protein